MFAVFQSVSSLLKIGTVSIDNWVFKLHYKVTVILLVVFSILVNCSQYFGDPIDCVTSDDKNSKYVDTYCWFNSYTYVNGKDQVYLQQKKDRFGAVLPPNPEKAGYHRVWQTYYQWIGLILILQAGFFFLPRFLWKKVFEEGRVKELVNGFQAHVQEEEEIQKRQKKVVEYIQTNQGHHLSYALKFFLCEVLNFVNVFAQIFITDWFLGFSFLQYGVSWLAYDPDSPGAEIYHPSHRYFPKEAYCDIYKGSSGGAVENYSQVRCVLPIQIFNEKIYLFLWFYFIVLAVISAAMLVYRVLIVLFPSLRYYMFRRNAWATDEKILKEIVYEYDIGDWFIVYQIMRNMDPFMFGRLMKSVYETLNGGRRFSRTPYTEVYQESLLGTQKAGYDVEKAEKLG